MSETPDTKTFFTPNKVIYSTSNVHGLGIFAAQDIKKGELVERCPMIPLAFRARYHTDPQIYKYMYAQPMCDCSECKNHGFIFHMLLGYGMLYNHSDDPNSEWIFDWKQLFANLIATKDISQKEEVFIDYEKKYFVGKQFNDKALTEIDTNSNTNA